MLPTFRMSGRAVVALVALLAIVMTACSEPTVEPAVAASPDAFEAASQRSTRAPTIEILSPTNGATVESPFTIQARAENFRLAPKGKVLDGEGHLHVVVSGVCVEPGEVIVDDDSHVHFGGGADELVVDLPPGEYSLCVQAGDGFHVALSVADQVTVSVVAPDGEAADAVEHDMAGHSSAEHAEHGQSTEDG